MARKKWPKALEKRVFESANGNCYHCGKKLRFSPRNTWHIDHHPVAYRDIEDQCCIGVTDEHDETNLKLSCVKCNLSHKHEVTTWCGDTQFPCKKRFWRKTVCVAISVFALAATNLLTHALSRC